MDKSDSHLHRSTQLHNLSVNVLSGGDARPARAVLHVTSQKLFAGAHEIEITHQSARYRLRQTALGKLILTK